MSVPGPESGSMMTVMGTVGWAVSASKSGVQLAALSPG